MSDKTNPVTETTPLVVKENKFFTRTNAKRAAIATSVAAVVAGIVYAVKNHDSDGQSLLDQIVEDLPTSE